MNKKIFPWSAVAFLAMVLTGCGIEAHYIDPTGDDALVTVSSVDPVEWIRVASQAADSLVASGALRRSDGQAPVVMVSRIRNYTLLHLETSLLTGRLRQAILKSGQATVSSAVGYGGNVDLAVRRIRDKENDDIFNQDTVQKRGTVIAPNFSLGGMIVQQTAYSGRTEESYYMFHLTLTDLATGVAVWETNIDFAKQATRPIL